VSFWCRVCEYYISAITKFATDYTDLGTDLTLRLEMLVAILEIKIGDD